MRLCVKDLFLFDYHLDGHNDIEDGHIWRLNQYMSKPSKDTQKEYEREGAHLIALYSLIFLKVYNAS